MFRYLGTFQDASYGGFGGVQDDGEIFTSIRAAKNALRERYESNGHRRCRVEYPEFDDSGCLTGGVRETREVFFPAVTREATIALYAVTVQDGTIIVHDNYLIGAVEFGPRGGVHYVNA